MASRAEQFLLEKARHQSTQFVLGRWTPPLVGKRLLQPANFAFTNMDGIGRGRVHLAAVDQLVAGEQDRASDDEVKTPLDILEEKRRF